MKKNDETKNKEEINMATLTKPSVFEVIVNNTNKDEIMKKIKEPRLTKDFFKECAEISKKLRKDNPDNK